MVERGGCPNENQQRESAARINDENQRRDSTTRISGEYQANLNLSGIVTLNWNS